MRKRRLNDKQILFVCKNNQISNIELAAILGVKPGLIGTYKTRMRKLGLNVPKNTMPKGSNIMDSIQVLLTKHGYTQ